MGNAILPDFAGLRSSRPRSPTFKTDIETAVSGREFRASRMANPIYRFSLGFEFLRESSGRAELRQLEGFYMARRGSFDSWRYRCEGDCDAVDQLIGYGDGQRTQFQLVRSFGEFIEPVQNLDLVTAIRRDALVLPATSYTISATGILILNQAPAGGVPVYWSGSYYFRCRFASDEVSFERIVQRLYRADRIEFLGSLGVKI